MSNKKYMKVLAGLTAAVIMLSGCSGSKVDPGTTETGSSEAPTEEPKPVDDSTQEDAKDDEMSYVLADDVTFTYDIQDDGQMVTGIGDTSIYTEDDLVWEDNFDGDSLDTTAWNYEPHEVGWVNNESQRYVGQEENEAASLENKNVIVKDGYLILQAHKYQYENGNVAYTSGRINTQDKQDYMYGRFEARLMVPYDNAFLPAFWMMPTDESYYGQWPKCGEIDIMEVLGQSTDTSYATLHYGEPHRESQGSKQLAADAADYSKSFHVYAVEWDPGEFRWYVDGELIHTENDWFTKVDGEEEKAYPAPFDQDFYMILNLAVGGSWPGDPDPSGVFGENAAMYVDYVKVYQKSEYDTNVSKPEKVYHFKEADATGNYVSNSDFSEAEVIDDQEGWFFLTAGEGKASAEIHDGEIQINTENPGELDYSVQLVQPGMPMIQGNKYRYSFEAYADEERTLKAAITAPDVSWIRYLNDTVTTIGTDWATYTFDFEMKEESDENGRVEFNMGNQPSSATIHIRNVRLEVIE
ncbi:MAG: family 16 glycosylhydrolase [Lachnospiraceae bacterium]|nr:family 16 glycosylhydrolase [Lachnospiraceae bacterium]MBR1567572.1 family 16 glycosylhydrolase [Lachnospiraceae bacterium]